MFDRLESQFMTFMDSVLNMLYTLSYVYWIPALCTVLALLVFIGVAPLHTHAKSTSFEAICVLVRKVLIGCLIPLVSVPLLFTLLSFVRYEISFGNAFDYMLENFNPLWIDMLALPIVLITCMLVKVSYRRYARPQLSYWWKSKRKQQDTDQLSDIRDLQDHFKMKTFLPEKYYSDNGLFIGLDENNNPDYIPFDTWYEVNAQIIGPSRYGKGILLGCLIDQMIKRGDGVVYVDPKTDHFLPHIMYQACQQAGRKFYYLALHDYGPGYWAPFAGGNVRQALARLELAFGLQYTGNPGTDFYKSQERAALESVFGQTRSIKGLRKQLESNESTLRINAELKRWSEVKTLCPDSQQPQFTIEKALEENAVVYVHGSLDDPIVTMATKLFIMEYVQTASSLYQQKKRQAHLTMFIDEVSFLASQTLAKSLATSIGFKVNFVLAYQSSSDLLNVDDKTVDPGYLLQSINVNSQVKMMYGGFDSETAKMISEMSGTISKTLVRTESTEVDTATGSETWGDSRSLTQQESPLIHTNDVLTLPKRVFVLFRPHSMATIRYSSFVPVKDDEALPSYIADRFKVMPCDVVEPAEESLPDELVSDTEDAHTEHTPVQPKKSQNSKGWQKEKNTFEGVVLNHGQAPYQHKPQNSTSYFVELEGQSIKTVWGTDLRRIMQDVQIGSTIRLVKHGQQPVVVSERDELEDEATAPRTTTIHRTAWSVEVLALAPAEKGSEQIKPKVNTSPAKKWLGELLSHGEDHYNFDQSKNLSYYVKIKLVDGTSKTLWGVDLPAALVGIEVGTLIELQFLRNRPVKPTDPNASDSLKSHNVWLVRQIESTTATNKSRRSKQKNKSKQRSMM